MSKPAQPIQSSIRPTHQAYSRDTMKDIVGPLLKKRLAYARAFVVSASECCSTSSYRGTYTGSWIRLHMRESSEV